MNQNIVISLALAGLMITFAVLGRMDAVTEQSANAAFWMLLGLSAGLAGSGCLSHRKAC